MARFYIIGLSPQNNTNKNYTIPADLRSASNDLFVRRADFIDGLIDLAIPFSIEETTSRFNYSRTFYLYIENENDLVVAKTILGDWPL